MRKKRFWVGFLVCLMLLSLLPLALLGCGSYEEEAELTVLCTTFPLYDWTRQIVGEVPTVSVSLLIGNGTDAHSYQPTPSDVAALKRCDVAVLVGGDSDAPIKEVLELNDRADQLRVELMAMEGVTLRRIGAESGSHHDHDHGERHHDSPYDEHVWLSLKNAVACVRELTELLAARDPEHAEEYRANGAAYAERLLALDERYAETVGASHGAPLLFADRFPFLYLAEDYGLHTHAAFEGCSADVGASFATVVGLAELVKELGVTKIMVTESSDGELAQTVIRAAGREEMAILALDSLQSVTKKEIEGGKSYLSVMEGNLAILAEALAG